MHYNKKKRYKMAVFTVSDNDIDILKKKRLWVIILTVIITMVTWGGLSFFSMVIISMISVEIFIISLCVSVVIISVVLFFSLKYSLKLLEKEMKSIQYIFENERLIIKKNNFEQFNVAKADIQNINKYKNNVIIIILNTNQKITVEKNLDNFDQLIENLNILSQVNNIDRSPSIVKKIGIGIIQIIVAGTLCISTNIIFVAVSGLITMIYCINKYFDKSISIKIRKLFLVCGIILIISQIIRLIFS
jgi:hypothetical protein